MPSRNNAHADAPPLPAPAVMLLGQAESGKSTLQKQFQLYYSSSTLEKERPSWRPIVYFNVLKAVRMILDELEGYGVTGNMVEKDFDFVEGFLAGAKASLVQELKKTSTAAKIRRTPTGMRRSLLALSGNSS